MVAYTCNLTYLGGRDQEDWRFEGSLGKKLARTSHLQPVKTGGLAQVAEHLTSKCKALSSNSSTSQSINQSINK
jgi:hypothetical protein